MPKIFHSPSKNPPVAPLSSILKGVEFINIGHILRDPEILKSLPTSSKMFPMSMVTYKLTNICRLRFSILISLSTI